MSKRECVCVCVWETESEKGQKKEQKQKQRQFIASGRGGDFALLLCDMRALLCSTACDICMCLCVCLYVCVCVCWSSSLLFVVLFNL